MDRRDAAPQAPRWSRRQLLLAGSSLLTGAGGLALAGRARAGADPSGSHAHSGGAGAPLNPFDPQDSLRRFERGQVLMENGRPVRVFELEARSITLQLAAGVPFKAWSLNGRVPGPTLRARVGERIRVQFRNGDSTSHSLHVHGVHPAAMDGIEPVLQGRSTIYSFDLEEAGLFPYHCHVAPVARHVGKGMYGLLVVDPATPRPAADELVLVMGGYDLNNDGRNELYAFNGIPDAYLRQPIRIRRDALIRLYLLNMTELEPPLTFHLHANSFQVLRSGWSERTDVLTLGMAERQILEFRYRFPGRYMVHPHQDPIAERGCMGLFEVTDG
ncbi:MAG: multicopper oxidase domain-containing protein [Cyanobium sp.]